MKLKSLAVLVSAAVATALSSAPLTHASDASSLSANSISAAQDESPKRWFVELSGPAVVQGVTPGAVGREQAAFRQAAKAAGISFDEKFQYQTLWNGFSVETSFANAGKLRAIRGVQAIYPVIEIDAPARPEQGSVGNVASAIALTGVDIARADLGLTGKNIKVAIIDSGIDYHHPDLGGCFGPGCKVAYGFDFVGDAYNSGDPNNNVPIPDDDPDDCGGHGTHVAGIVGAKAAGPGGVTGVAPDVTLGAYRVFGCSGSSSADVIIAALERAYLDGMHVVNQSLGAAFQWPQYPTGTVGDRLVAQGVVVVASAGNSGANGTFSIGAPGVGRDVIGVASYDNVAFQAPYFLADGNKVGYSVMTFSANPPTSGTEEYVYIGRACIGDELLADPAGKFALAVRGVCPFAEKAANAVAAGATGVVIHNNAAGLFFGTLGATPAYDAPVVGISLADGLLLRGLDPAEFTWTDQEDSFPNPTGGLISSFSSWGLSPDLALKPDLGGPGGFIYSTYPVERGAYATLSGTSMSAPHVAGAVAMLLEAKPTTRAADVRDILQNTAQPKNWSGNPGLGFLEPVHRQGAGMIDITAAILNPLHVSPGKISLGESQAGPQAITLTVANSSDEAVTLQPSFVNALTTWRATPPFGTSAFLSNASVVFAESSVTVPAGGTATIEATVIPPATASDRLYGGYIRLTSDLGTLRVPYAGFTGDYQAIPPLTENNFAGATFPWLATLDEGTFLRQTEPATYTMQDGNFPYLLFNVSHQVRRLEFEVLHADSEVPVHPDFSKYLELDYFGRNSTLTTFFSLGWDGTRTHSAGNSDLFKVLPNGSYKLSIKALKALGDPANPDHWEIWTSPTINIARPEEPKKKTINLRGNGRN
jgi:minor extracellular serine protease Vpr